MVGRKSPTARKIVREISDITAFLVEKGLADDQNSAYEKSHVRDRVTVEFSGSPTVTNFLKDQSYEELYNNQLADRIYNIRMLDGALIQMWYEFVAGKLQRYRLAFLPSPNLIQFQADPELYLEEALYADILDKSVVTIPLRFDFDNRTNVAKNVRHPASHLTLGQYSNCRVAVTVPIGPYLFVEFLLRAFYNTASSLFAGELPRGYLGWPRCITADEERVIHIGAPHNLALDHS